MADEIANPLTIAQYLAALGAEETVVTGQWFHKQQISLDGRRFSRCFFEECTLTLLTADFAAEDCKFSKCFFQFGTPALTAARVMNLINLSCGFVKPENWSEIPEALRPILKGDGILSF